MQVGGFLGESGGWRWVAALIAIFTGILTVLGAIMIPETYAPVLLRQRATRLSKATGKTYRTKYEKDKPVVIKELYKAALTRPWQLLFLEPIVFLLSLYLAIVYATLYVRLPSHPHTSLMLTTRCSSAPSRSCFSRSEAGPRASAAWRSSVCWSAS